MKLYVADLPGGLVVSTSRSGALGAARVRDSWLPRDWVLAQVQGKKYLRWRAVQETGLVPIKKFEYRGLNRPRSS